jgi:hypothetical protein
MNERLHDKLKGLLDADEERALVTHLRACNDCREEAQAIEQLWTRLGEFDEEVPSERMRARFYAAISAYQEETSGGLLQTLRESFYLLWPKRPAVQLGLALATLVLGLSLGTRVGPSPAAEIDDLREEVQSMGRMISLSLLDHRSASERLRGVDWSQRATPDPQVVGALLDAVKHDPSVNVRVAAVEALTPLLQQPRVSSQLLASLKEQESPMVQVTLARALIDSDVNGSAQAVSELIDSDHVDESAREHLRDLVGRTG